MTQHARRITRTAQPGALPVDPDLQRLRAACHWARHASPMWDGMLTDCPGTLRPVTSLILGLTLQGRTCTGGDLTVWATDTHLNARRIERTHQAELQRALPGRLRRPTP